jgi:hypothetical protein
VVSHDECWLSRSRARLRSSVYRLSCAKNAADGAAPGSALQCVATTTTTAVSEGSCGNENETSALVQSSAVGAAVSESTPDSSSELVDESSNCGVPTYLHPGGRLTRSLSLDDEPRIVP